MTVIDYALQIAPGPERGAINRAAKRLGLNRDTLHKWHHRGTLTGPVQLLLDILLVLVKEGLLDLVLDQALCKKNKKRCIFLLR